MEPIYYLIQDSIIALITVFAFALLIVGLIAYYRTRVKKLFLVSCAFGLFAAKGVIMSAGLYLGYLDVGSPFVLMFDFMLTLDLVILLMLYFALFKR